jgi:hypothetical protein
MGGQVLPEVHVLPPELPELFESITDMERDVIQLVPAGDPLVVLASLDERIAWVSIYGGIFVEYSMPYPESISGRTQRFYDFYLGGNHFALRSLERLARTLNIGDLDGPHLWAFSTPQFGENNCTLSEDSASVLENLIASLR